MAAAAALAPLAGFAAGRAAAQPEVVGPVYPILEPDMLEQIEKRLRAMERSGELSKKIDEAKQRSLRSVEHPPAVPGLGRASVNRTYYYDPSVRVNQDIRDAEGKVLVKAGTQVNPLDYAAMTTWLLFFDGSDPRQVALAERVGQQYGWALKPILVAGGPLELSRRWKRQVYFDQGGFLVHKLGIQNVPALVTQEGKEMRIDELRY